MVVTGCLYTLTGNSGVFTSPNYPANYENNLRCSWLINADPATAILLRFNSFSTERCCDFVTVTKPLNWVDSSKLHNQYGRYMTVLRNLQTNFYATATTPLQPLSNRLPTLCWSRSPPTDPSYHPALRPCMKLYTELCCQSIHQLL